jgi:hypothetical protein
MTPLGPATLIVGAIALANYDRTRVSLTPQPLRRVRVVRALASLGFVVGVVINYLTSAFLSLPAYWSILVGAFLTGIPVAAVLITTIALHFVPQALRSGKAPGT